MRKGGLSFDMNHTKEKRNQEIMKMIHQVVVPATGCTEPVAIALNAATAKMNLKGSILKASLKLDPGVFKNAMGATIPGIRSRGPANCAAVGILIGSNEKGMNILSGASLCSNEQVESLIPQITVSIAEGRENLFIETILMSECESVRVITEREHANIVSIERASAGAEAFRPWTSSYTGAFEQMDAYDLGDLIEFADSVRKEELAFFRSGVAMNKAIAECGMELQVGDSYRKLDAMGCLDGSLVFEVSRYASCASYARMSGEILPVMTVTGSGNQGIVLFLPIYYVARKFQVPEEKMLRAIAFAQAFNLYAKHFVGILSPMCSCGVASGVAASAGIVYLLDGTREQIEGCIRTIISCITGMVCDGAKESCSSKVGVSAALAVISAIMSLNDLSAGNAGIVTFDIRDLYEGVGVLSSRGMENANAVMINLMLERQNAKTAAAS
jgi:L-cysteine desulfidase